jgi:hypothetical protein
MLRAVTPRYIREVQPMRRISTLCFAVAFSLLSAAPASAWGSKGHQIVAAVAERGLSSPASAMVAQLLGDRTLQDVATLPDDWRRSRPETAGWHFVDIPITDAAYDPARDCPTQDGDVGHNCVVAAIEHFRTVLADTTATKDKRAEALIFLTHFIGDIHQPLHCADNDDRGGNQVTVKFMGSKTNLHSVWDTALLNRRGMDVDGYADFLLQDTLGDRNPADLQAGPTIKWANEAYKLAKTNAYKVPKSGTLGQAYVDRNLPVVDQQLLKAGLRLRAVVEAALAPSAELHSAAAMMLKVASGQKHVGNADLYPDPAETPGIPNPNATQANIKTTVCKSGWTATIRPPTSYTNKLKKELMARHSLPGKLGDYELDHFISLQLGGDPTDPKNLWMEPYEPKPGARQKDTVEGYLKREVCAGRMTLQEAQQSITGDWYNVYLQTHP